MLKYDTISVDGIDKAGKGITIRYLYEISNYTLNIVDRGIISNIVWNKFLGRSVDYNLDFWKNIIIVHLYADKADWQIRCKMTNEPPLPISYEEMTKMYKDEVENFKQMGFKTLSFNTSKHTTYDISNAIFNEVLKLNNVDTIFSKKFV